MIESLLALLVMLIAITIGIITLAHSGTQLVLDLRSEDQAFVMAVLLILLIAIAFRALCDLWRWWNE